MFTLTKKVAAWLAIASGAIGFILGVIAYQPFSHMTIVGDIFWWMAILGYFGAGIMFEKFIQLKNAEEKNEQVI